MLIDAMAQTGIREFADYLGTKASFADDGSCAFRFAQSGLFSMVGSPDGRDLVLTLRRAQNTGNFDFKEALKAGASDVDYAGPLVSVGLNQSAEVVVSMRLMQTAVSLQTLLAALELLKKRQRDIGF
jgi:hypothetical protein